MQTNNLRLILFLLIIGIFAQTEGKAFAVLSHEAIIDEAWDANLRPLLIKKFPQASQAQIDSARAYLYGGSVLPDIGYMPAGSKIFSNLVHYVRTGDFVNNLLSEAKTLNEYAFALGFLCHYTADRYGHPLATNKAVPLLFPSAQRKYGSSVSYEQGEKYHARTEFSFDVFQVVNGRYEPDAYRNFIGFKVSESVLEKAFLKTYGLSLKDVFTNFDTAVKVFRFSVRKIIPSLIKASSQFSKGKMLEGGKKPAIYKTDYKAYNKEYGKPGIKSMGFTFIILIMPKVGPLSAIRTKSINEEVKTFFKKSFDEIVIQYNASLNRIKVQAPDFENVNFDTGNKTAPGEYELGDKTYYELLMQLEKHNFEKASPELQRNIAAYYAQKDKLHKAFRQKRKWKKIQAALNQFQKK
jgi:Zinc dependent phospholipase C